MPSSLKQTAQKMAQEFITKGVTSGGFKTLAGPAGIFNAVAGKISKETLGYNFPNLLMNLGIFYLVGFLIDAVFAAIIEGSGFVKFIATLFGKQLPNVLPPQIVDFYRQGYHGFKYWDAVHLIALVAVASEAFRYYKSNEETGGKASYFTLSIFAMILGAIFMLVGPSLVQRLKEIQNLASGAGEGPATNAPPNVGPAWLPGGYSYKQGSDGNYYALISRADGTSAWQLAVKLSDTAGQLQGPLLVNVP